MSVTVSRTHSASHNFLTATWFHSKAGDEAITCTTGKPISGERLLDHGCSYILRGYGKEKELYQEHYDTWMEGDVLNHRFPAETTVTAMEDNSVWCYICDKDESKVITGKTLFVPEYKIVMMSADDKDIYLFCPHEDVEIDGELLDRKEIKKINAGEVAILTSKKDIYIATFTYD
jgi:hypothetical protein